MAPRVIDDAELVWMLRGQARFVADSGELVLSPGLLLLVPPGLRHGFEWDTRGTSRHGYVHFDPGLVAGGPGGRAPSRRMTERDPMAGLCAYLLWLGGDRPPAWEDQVRTTLRFLVPLLVSGALPGDAVHAPVPAPVSAALDHLRREWSELPLRRVGVGELAAAAAVSRSYLNRLFRSEFGLSTGAALEELRCSRAETLLARTDMTVGSIARQCGFADLYHFSHRFTRRRGVAPSAYRAAGSEAASALDHPGVRRLAHRVWGEPGHQPAEGRWYARRT